MNFKEILKEKHIMIDDEGLIYEVVEVMNNSAVVVPIGNPSEFSCEIMTFDSMNKEGWWLPNIEIIGGLPEKTNISEPPVALLKEDEGIQPNPYYNNYKKPKRKPFNP